MAATISDRPRGYAKTAGSLIDRKARFEKLDRALLRELSASFDIRKGARDICLAFSRRDDVPSGMATNTSHLCP